MLLSELWGHDVTEVSDAREALERFQAGRFDLVVTDFFMPPFLGSELARRIKEIAPEVPVLMITGYPQKLSGSANPVDFILTKPFTLPELRQALERLFGPVSIPAGAGLNAAPAAAG
jgi:CheY-like chemotaxis protein